MSKLTNLKGRINYISSPARQENLYAVYGTCDRKFWNELAKCNQQEFLKNGTMGKCIEARELIIALPESFPNLYNADVLLQLLTDRFKETYHVECISALHHNKRKTNYHIHLIFSERKLLPQPIEKIATRNMFYDERGKHMRTKKEVLDDSGNIRNGCKIIKKGEVYERNLFTAKYKFFKQEEFLDEVKHFYTDLVNLLIEDKKEKLHVFEKNGLYLATKKIGKNNPKAEQVRADNEVRIRWNREVDRAIVSEIPDTEIRQIKKEYITDRTKQSFELFGNRPERLGMIIETAIMALSLLISQALAAARKITEMLFKEPYLEKTKFTSSKIQDKEQSKLKVPQKPVITPDAEVYPRFMEIKDELSRQNENIFEIERKRALLEVQRDDLKGFAKIAKRSELQSKIDQKNKEVDILKIGLSETIKKYGFANMQEFYAAYKVTQTAYQSYQHKLAKWEEVHSKNITPCKESFEERLQNYKKKSSEQQRERTYTFREKGDR